MKCVILFDLDGTLIDSTEAILGCFRRTFRDAGVVVPDDGDIKALIGHPLDFMYLHLGIPEAEVWEFVDAYKACYRECSRALTHLLPGAREAIEEAASFARLGIVTTKTGLYSRILLEHMQVMDYFEVLIGREDVIHPKPHAEPVVKALHAMGVGPSENVWMIGDTCLDMVSAKDAEIRALGVLSGYGTETELQKCSEYLHKNVLFGINFIKTLQKKQSLRGKEIE